MTRKTSFSITEGEAGGAGAAGSSLDGVDSISDMVSDAAIGEVSESASEAISDKVSAHMNGATFQDHAASVHYAHTYHWPIDPKGTRAEGHVASHAEFHVESAAEPYVGPHVGPHVVSHVCADASADGLLRTYQYRASISVGSSADKANASVFAPAWQSSSSSAFASPFASAFASPFVYRHDHASSMIADGDAMPSAAHVFARESFFDETAHALSSDPIAFRMHHLDRAEDAGARAIVQMVSERAAWGGKDQTSADASWLRGRGFAMDGTVRAFETDSTAGEKDGSGKSEVLETSDTSETSGESNQEPSWSAWIVDLDVHRETGDIAVRRVVAGYGEGRDGPPRLDGVPHALVESAVSNALGTPLLARARYDETLAADGATSPASFDIVSAAQGVSLRSTHDGGELSGARAARAIAPAAAAIANAIFDATGVRFREPPFDAVRLKSELADAIRPEPVHQGVDAVRPGRFRRLLAGSGVAGVVGGLIGLACAIIPGPREIAPIVPGSIDASTWSPATLERGRLVALTGDCAVCHTAQGGKSNAGGFPLLTPFGTIYSTNITPDAETGIGLWSYPAFERAMRTGIARDGKHLYPAFPYTSFAKMSEADMLALYAWLMTQTPVNNKPPQTSLPFPLNVRPAVAAWNWLFLDGSEYRPDLTKSAEWNRGKYLTDGAAHCSACHTPRNRLGAEKSGVSAYLTGGEAEGWVAPSLVGSKGPVPWTEGALFDYLRTGFSKEHGVAAGPMGPVVSGLAQLPESDVRAIAHYITSLSPKVDDHTAAMAAQRQAEGVAAVDLIGYQNGQRTFEVACAVCHASSGGVGHLGVRPLMGLNTSVAHAKPDNLLHVLYNGIDNPATGELGYMPGFRDAYDDKQMADLAAYIRARYAPDQPAWTDLEKVAEKVRHVEH